MTTPKTLRVTGTGMISLKPDTTMLNITVTGVFKDYAETLKHSSEDTAALRSALEPLGFTGDMLRTASFNVDPRYEGYNDKNGNYRQRFMGYEFRHSLMLEFPSDNDLLGKTLYALAHSSVTPEFGISYTVKDKEAAKNALIANAVKDAMRKAEILAEAAEVDLGFIQSIDYSIGGGDFVVRPMNGRMFKASMACEEDAAYGGSFDMDIAPEDIRVSDTVTVVWDID